MPGAVAAGRGVSGWHAGWLAGAGSGRRAGPATRLAGGGGWQRGCRAPQGPERSELRVAAQQRLWGHAKQLRAITQLLQQRRVAQALEDDGARYCQPERPARGLVRGRHRLTACVAPRVRCCERRRCWFVPVLSLKRHS
jgi:hypothetical protein